MEAEKLLYKLDWEAPLITDPPRGNSTTRHVWTRWRRDSEADHCIEAAAKARAIFIENFSNNKLF